MPQRGNPQKTIALLGAFCLFLSTIEYLIPKPLPFMRIGIANLPLMLAVDILSFKQFALLAIIKIMGQALVTGTLFSYIFLFSLAGTLLSSLTMFALRHLFGQNISFIGIGTAGALLSNLSQLLMASFFVFGKSARYIAPPFLGAGLITGISLGAFCLYFSRKSRWWRGDPEASYTKIEKNGETVRRSGQEKCRRLFCSRDLCITGLLIMPSLLFNPSITGRVFQFLLFYLFALLTGKKNNMLMTLLVILGIVFFNMLVPYGRVLWSLGTFQITAGALSTGIRRAVTLEGLIMLSRASIRHDLRLPGNFGALIGESLRMFALITERKGRFTGKSHNAGSLIANLDELLLELDADKPAQSAASRAPRSSASGIGILAIALVVSWLLFLQARFP
jgi:heptaprenyl diphosphate synthase